MDAVQGLSPFAWTEAPEAVLSRYRAMSDAQMARAEEIAAEVLRNPPASRSLQASHQSPSPPANASTSAEVPPYPAWPPSAVSHFRAALAATQGAPPPAANPTPAANSTPAPRVIDHPRHGVTIYIHGRQGDQTQTLTDEVSASHAEQSGHPPQEWEQPTDHQQDDAYDMFASPQPHEPEPSNEYEPSIDHDASQDDFRGDQEEGGQAASMDWQADENPAENRPEILAGGQRAGTPMPRGGEHHEQATEWDADVDPLGGPWSPRTPGVVLHTQSLHWPVLHGLQGGFATPLLSEMYVPMHVHADLGWSAAMKGPGSI